MQKPGLSLFKKKSNSTKPFLAIAVRLYSTLATTYLIEQQPQSEIACPALFASLLVKENVKNPGRQ
jgi:hypothetical protein